MSYVFNAVRWAGCFLLSWAIIFLPLAVINHFIYRFGWNPIFSLIVLMCMVALAHYWWIKGIFKSRHSRNESQPPQRFAKSMAQTMRILGITLLIVSVISALVLQPTPSLPTFLISYLPFPLIFFLLAWFIELIEMASNKYFPKKH